MRLGLAKLADQEVQIAGTLDLEWRIRASNRPVVLEVKITTELTSLKLITTRR